MAAASVPAFTPELVTGDPSIIPNTEEENGSGAGSTIQALPRRAQCQLQLLGTS